MHLLLVFLAIHAYPVVQVMLAINFMICVVNQISLAQVLFYRVECPYEPNCSSFNLEHVISDKVPDNLFNNEDQEHCNEKTFFSVSGASC
jgi:hypothetical protein